MGSSKKLNYSLSLLLLLVLSVGNGCYLHAQEEDNLKADQNHYPLKTSYFESVKPVFRYRGSLKSPIGFVIGPVGYYSGAYVSFRFGGLKGDPFGIVGQSTPICNEDYVTSGDEDYNYVKTGESAIGQGGLTIGYISRFHYNLLWFAGAGYGWYSHYDQYDENHKRLSLSFEEWAYFEEESTKGLETEAGIMIDLKYITLSAGLAWTNFIPRTMVLTFGIGTPLTKVRQR